MSGQHVTPHNFIIQNQQFAAQGQLYNAVLQDICAHQDLNYRVFSVFGFDGIYKVLYHKGLSNLAQDLFLQAYDFVNDKEFFTDRDDIPGLIAIFENLHKFFSDDHINIPSINACIDKLNKNNKPNLMKRPQHVPFIRLSDSVILDQVALRNFPEATIPQEIKKSLLDSNPTLPWLIDPRMKERTPYTTSFVIHPMGKIKHKIDKYDYLVSCFPNLMRYVQERQQVVLPGVYQARMLRHDQEQLRANKEVCKQFSEEDLELLLQETPHLPWCLNLRNPAAPGRVVHKGEVSIPLRNILLKEYHFLLEAADKFPNEPEQVQRLSQANVSSEILRLWRSMQADPALSKDKSVSESVKAQISQRHPELICPLSDKVLIDPLLLVQTGVSYDRHALKQYFEINGIFDPATNKPLMVTKPSTCPNKTLADLAARIVSQYQQELSREGVPAKPSMSF